MSLEGTAPVKYCSHVCRLESLHNSLPCTTPPPETSKAGFQTCILCEGREVHDTFLKQLGKWGELKARAVLQQLERKVRTAQLGCQAQFFQNLSLSFLNSVQACESTYLQALYFCRQFLKILLPGY